MKREASPDHPLSQGIPVHQHPHRKSRPEEPLKTRAWFIQAGNIAAAAHGIDPKRRFPATRARQEESPTQSP